MTLPIGFPFQGFSPTGPRQLARGPDPVEHSISAKERRPLADLGEHRVHAGLGLVGDGGVLL
ncbi:hypothetical protein, partial [Eggerthella sinensis]|uniref:hypothetical protein n=1 Tax=Eggerthella sinensis TaxID=242230 RepID=UPI00248DF259